MNNVKIHLKYRYKKEKFGYKIEETRKKEININMSHDKSVITELDSYLTNRKSDGMENSPVRIETDEKIIADEILLTNSSLKAHIKRLDPVYIDQFNTANTFQNM